MKKLRSVCLVSFVLASSVALAMSGVAGASPTSQQTPTSQVAAPVAESDIRVDAPGSTLTAPSNATAATPTWLTMLNRERAQFGVGPVVLDSQLSADMKLHTDWMVRNQQLTHYPKAGTPGYTAAGAAAAASGDLARSSKNTSPEGFVEMWFAAPFHMMALLNPNLSRVGFAMSGSDSTGYYAGLYIRARSQADTSAYPLVWPHGETSLTTYSGNESPDPFSARRKGSLVCPTNAASGQAGLPIIVDFGRTGAAITQATAQLVADGTSVATCVTLQSDYTDATAKYYMNRRVLVIPVAPLRQGTTYTGTVTTNLGTATVNFTTLGTTPTPTKPTPTTPAKPTPTVPVTPAATGVRGDQNGDSRADIVAVGADGRLYWYPFNGAGLGNATSTGGGWQTTNWITQVDDLNHDGRSELLARRTDGTMWLYRGLGAGKFAPGVQVGHGWSGFSTMVIVPDATGDGVPELVGINRSNGKLYRYTFNGLKGMSDGAVIGRGFGSMGNLISAGDFSGDGVPDLFGVARDGQLWLYAMNGAGAITSQSLSGHGWGQMNLTFTPGDMTGDGRIDLVSRSADGSLYLYANQGNSWGVAQRIGVRWDSIRLMS